MAQLREALKHTQKFFYINRQVKLVTSMEPQLGFHSITILNRKKHKAQLFIGQMLSGLTSASRTKLLWSLHMCVSLQQAVSETWGMLQYWSQEVSDDEGRTKASVLPEFM